MTEEKVVEVSPPAVALDHHKRKHEDLEPQASEPAVMAENEVDESNLEVDGVQKDEEIPVGIPDSSEAKRPRLDAKPDDLANENGHQAEKQGETAEELSEDIAVADDQLGDDQHPPEKVLQEVNEEHVVGNGRKIDGQESLTDNTQPDDDQVLSSENAHLDNVEKPYEDEHHQQAVDVPELGDFTSEQHVLESGSQATSRKIEVPNNKVGVLIGKSGDTIRMLQYNSGAKIQIMRDAEADPHAATRPVELIGPLESIIKAEKLIKDVIAEADAGGSPSLVARGFNPAVTGGAAEQIQIQVPNEKVGLIIGKGGETIKGLQTRSGARIQLIPQHLPDGDQSKERTVRVSGDQKQIEMARELIKEVMNQNVRSSSNYHQQSYRPRGPSSMQQWGGRAPQSGQPMPYEYQQRGPYPSQNQQYPSSYGAFAPRSSYGSGWEHRPPPMQQQGPPPHTQGGSYDYYGGQGGHGHPGNISASGPHPTHMGPPHTQANYNYGQPRGPDYGQPTPYSQSAPPPHHQTYGHGQGYPDSQALPLQSQHQHQQQPYGGPQPSQQGTYPDAAAHQGYGYAPQQQFNKPAMPYSVASQGPPSQSYAPSAASQPGPGDMQPYQVAPVTSVQSYGQNVQPQQPYPYASSGSTQAPYATAPAPVPATNDGYNQPPAMSGYPQQGYGQGYAHPTQQAPVYSQPAAPGGAYGQYPSQPSYSDPAAGYGYQQTQTDPAYAAGQAYSAGVAAPTVQQGYAQPVPAAAAPTPAPAPGPNQPGYDQSAGGYGAVPAPASAPVAYGKSLSPQPQPQPQPGYSQPQAQYDASQMYGAAR
ncbi:hypothetical protein Ancab_029054 [Ancistrocladus abbreviatus]